MKNKKILFGMMAVSAMVLTSCGGGQFMDLYAPEESGLNVMKITDETSNTVLGPSTGAWLRPAAFAASTTGGCKDAKFYWHTSRLLYPSPDGTELAYMSRINKQQNIMIRKASAQGAATQRTFRHISDFSWGNDGNLYFSDIANGEFEQVASTNAHVGSLIRQLTSNNMDDNPVVSKDGTMLFFTRTDKSGPSIWSLDLTNGSLTSCARGYNPCLLGDKNDTFLCVRNSSSGVSEIWLVNYVLGQETLILSDKKRGFTNPMVSPNGKWILCQGNSTSTINKKHNLDIFAVKIDGTGLVQLTYHPEQDCCPSWSADGRSVFFLSNRANKDGWYNVWKMRFDLN
ncbi:MAG: PD40 domain-containing protein [Bacteroides sp.]|nr:PD40 domain-containing protein [Bacteroides sp.]